jgi:hypothetical protein
MTRNEIDAVVVLLDPVPETLARARILTQRVVPVEDVTPRVLLDVVEGSPITPGPLPSLLLDGAAGPSLAWANSVREGGGAVVALVTADRRPLMASAFRGAGRTAAWAAWPSSRTDAVALAKEWAARTARPADWRRVVARREDGRVVVSMPPAAVPGGPLSFAGGARLRERTPGVFEAPESSPDGAALTILAGDRVLATVPLPPAGDPEYAFPAGLPSSGLAPAPARLDRLRAPWAALSALAWAAALFLRRRAA